MRCSWADGALHALFVTIIALPVAAQEPLVAPEARFANGSVDGVSPAATVEARRRAPAFLPELAGATVGSLAGLGLGLLVARPDHCDSEDMECILEGIGFVGLTTGVGGAGGLIIAGNWADTAPSGWGAAVGSIAGVVAGAGILKLLEELDDDTTPVGISVVAFTGTHAILTTIGSRIGAAIRD